MHGIGVERTALLEAVQHQRVAREERRRQVGAGIVGELDRYARAKTDRCWSRSGPERVPNDHTPTPRAATAGSSRERTRALTGTGAPQVLVTQLHRRGVRAGQPSGEHTERTPVGERCRTPASVVTLRPGTIDLAPGRAHDRGHRRLGPRRLHARRSRCGRPARCTAGNRTSRGS